MALSFLSGRPCSEELRPLRGSSLNEGPAKGKERDGGQAEGSKKPASGGKRAKPGRRDRDRLGGAPSGGAEGGAFSLIRPFPSVAPDGREVLGGQGDHGRGRGRNGSVLGQYGIRERGFKGGE